jgi:hypothetical protein
MRRSWNVSALLIGALIVALVAHRALWADEDDSVKSHPKDTTPYERDADPEDHERRPAPTVFLRDVVVSNTDATLTTTDTFNDGEPSIAVNPRDPREIVITAFSGSWGADAPLWHSLDGGETWTKEFTIARPPGVGGTTGCPCDQTVDYGRKDLLFGTFLTFSPTDVFSGATSNPANAGAWQWFAPGGIAQRTNHLVPSSFGNADQPWLLVNRDPKNQRQDNVYVAYDDFSSGPNMRVAVSYGSNPPVFTVDNQSGTSTGFVNPGHRLAVNQENGFVYSLFQRFTAPGAGGSKHINYMLNQSTDGGKAWTLNGSPSGIIVASADSTQPQPKFCTVNALLGGVLHAAVDPETNDILYVYGNRDPATGNNRLAIRRIALLSNNSVSVAPEHFVTGQVQAALPSVAITEDGIIGVLYDTCDGFSTSGFPIFSAHLAVSTDSGVTFRDKVLLTFLSVAKDNGNARQRVLGDYQQLKALHGTFYGVFTANGVPFGRPFANHDPIFFKVKPGDEED